MLSDGDRLLTQRDPDLPGLAAVLDPTALAARIATAYGIEAADGTASYMRYKPGHSCLVAYRFATPRPVRFYAIAMTRRRLEKARRRGVPAGVRMLADDALLLAQFPADRVLGALPEVADPARCAPLLNHMYPASPPEPPITVSTLRYKPERRYVGLVRAGEHAAERRLLKVLDATDYARARRVYSHLARLKAVPAPRLLGFDDEARSLLFEWAPGKALSAAAVVDLAAVSAAGAALAGLHQSGAAELPVVTPKRDLALLQKRARQLSLAGDDVADRAAAVVQALAGMLPAVGGPTAVVHGDMKPDQIIVTPTGVMLIDFDSAGIGDPLDDLSKFVATLEMDTIAGRVPAPRAGQFRAAFLNGYQRAGGVPLPAAFDSCVAATLIRLALQPLRERHPRWPRLSRAIVARAEALLAAG